MDRFSKYNPKSTFLFFLCVILLTIIIMHPVYLALSLLSGFIYKLILQRKKAFSYLFKFILPLILFISVFNFIFAHYGDTVLFAFRNIYFTFESLFYGFCQGMMVAGVIVWFSDYSIVITSERFLSVFGKIAPNTAMIFSSVLSFIPRMEKNYREIRDARKLLDEKNGKFKSALNVFSSVITMTLEDTISLGDSMKARGFSSKRKVYSKYRFNAKDFLLLFISLSIFIVLCIFKITSSLTFIFELVTEMGDLLLLPLVLHSLLVFLPVIIDFWEDIKWRTLKRKI